MKISGHSNGSITIYSEKAPTAAQFDEIENRINKEQADVLLMSTYPALHGGYIDPHDFCCEYPQSDALAVTCDAEKRFGKPCMALGTVAAYEYVNRVKRLGGSVAFAGDIALESHFLPDITDTLLDSILLDAKQEGQKEFKESFSRVTRAFRLDPALGNHSRKKFAKKLPAFCLKTLWYRTLGHSASAETEPADFNEMLKRGTYLAADTPSDEPLVSVVIRTHSRPNVLRETLKSLRYQIYKNIEYIVIEDGEPTAEEMICAEFADLPIRYHATGKNIGRSAAANLGFEMSVGKYINMLDDDDFLYPEHILTGVAEAEVSGCGIVFLESLALLTSVANSSDYEYEVKQVQFMHFVRIDPFMMSLVCETPNNGVFFKKELFNKCGGMNEKLGAHEDWNLWLRYMANSNWRVVPYASCAFANPYDREVQKKRIEQYSVYDGMQFDDPMIKFKTTPKQLKTYYRGCVEDCHFMAEKRNLIEYVKNEVKEKKITILQCTADVDIFAEAVKNASETRYYSSNEFRLLYSEFLHYLLSLKSDDAVNYIMRQYEKEL